MRLLYAVIVALFLSAALAPMMSDYLQHGGGMFGAGLLAAFFAALFYLFMKI